MTVLGIIPARGGSKGIPGKNIKLLAGRPLIYYTIAAAQESGIIDRLVLTTDSEEIAQVGRDLQVDVPFLRPEHLAMDGSTMSSAVAHVMHEMEKQGARFDFVVLLQPTSPLRRPEHIRSAVEKLITEDCDSVVSVVKIPTLYSPQKAMKLKEGQLVFWHQDGANITNRQETADAFAREGTIYAFKWNVMGEKGDIYGDRCLPLELDLEETLTLDTIKDWKRAERVFGSGAASASRTK